MTLQQWLSNAWIREIDPSREEVASLLSVARRELSDAAAAGLSSDGTFIHAYSAVRALCQVALHASGFQVPRGNREHERVIESVKFTLGDQWVDRADYFDRCRRSRHKSLYDSAGVVSRADAAELLEAARDLENAVTTWLSDKHPDLA